MSQTWTGGNGSGVYDPVTTTDNVQFGDSDDKVSRFTVRGGRTYNFGTYRKSGIKAVCDEIRNRSRPKCLFIVFVTTLVLILMMLAIVIAASHRRPDIALTVSEPWVNKTNGLVFIPWGLDNSAFIRFSLDKKEDINIITQTMDKFTSAYKLENQLSDKYVDCNSAYAPPDKICRQTLSTFGQECTSFSRYGYIHGLPCVLLILYVPQDVTARSYRPMDGQVYIEAVSVLGDVHISTDHIGVSCEPASPEDAKNVHDQAHQGDPVEYYPPTGFPTYVYRKRSIDEFLTPAVMVRFNTIRDFRPTRINCRAWGVFTDSRGVGMEQDLYRTSFVLHIN